MIQNYSQDAEDFPYSLCANHLSLKCAFILHATFGVEYLVFMEINLSIVDQQLQCFLVESDVKQLGAFPLNFTPVSHLTPGFEDFLVIQCTVHFSNLRWYVLCLCVSLSVVAITVKSKGDLGPGLRTWSCSLLVITSRRQEWCMFLQNLRRSITASGKRLYNFYQFVLCGE